VSSAGALFEALGAASPSAALRTLDEERVLTSLVPELEAGRGFRQPERHYYDVLDHNLAAVAAMEAVTGDGADARELRVALEWVDFDAALDQAVDGQPLMTLLRLAALVHDVAKPASSTIVDGALRFPRHGPAGAELMRQRLPGLGLGPEATEFVARLIRYHLRPGELVKAWPPTDHAVRRFANDLHGHVLPLMLLNLSDGMATRGPGYTRENFRVHIGLVGYVVARAWAATEEGERPLITGEDLMHEFDIRSGRLLGAVLTSVRRAQSAGTVSERDGALALAREILAGLKEERT